MIDGQSSYQLSAQRLHSSKSSRKLIFKLFKNKFKTNLKPDFPNGVQYFIMNLYRLLWLLPISVAARNATWSSSMRTLFAGGESLAMSWEVEDRGAFPSV